MMKVPKNFIIFWNSVESNSYFYEITCLTSSISMTIDKFSSEENSATKKHQFQLFSRSLDSTSMLEYIKTHVSRY